MAQREHRRRRRPPNLHYRKPKCWKILSCRSYLWGEFVVLRVYPSSLIRTRDGTQIPAPRDAGTCTRCPMEFRLSSASEGTPWSCQVSIRWEYDSNGRRSNSVREEPFGGPLADREDVDEVLRDAQRAVLDGQGAEQFAEGRNMNEVMPMPMPSMSQRGSTIGQPPRGQNRAVQSTPFSRNVVCVDVTGPYLADLAFVDLPGEHLLLEASSSS